MLRRKSFVFVTAAAASTVIASMSFAQAAPATSYHVVKKIAAGGEGGWDYLIADTASERLFVSHGTHVVVVDLARDSVIGDIPNTLGVHGIAFAPALNRGFTSNGRDTSVTIFNLKTLAPISTVKVTGRNPDAIVFDPFSGRVFTFNGGGANATAIDAATGVVAGTVPLGGKPEFSVSDGKGRMYVNIEDKSEVVVFDPKALTIKTRWPLAPCEEPSGMAMDRAHGRLFVVCSNKLMAILDATTGRVITTLPIGDGVDATGYDPATGLAFASNGEGTLTVVHEDSPAKFTVVGTVPTQRGARTMALDPKTHRIYLSTAQFGPPPAPTPERPNPRPTIIPGSFTILVLDR
jgi:DNA-binding beta-propeller fold protein YncE